MFEVTQEHDLPVLLVKLLDGRGESAFELVPSGGRRRSEFPVGDLTGHVDTRTIAVIGRDQRHLAVDAPRARHAVPAVGIDEAVAGHVPQPQPKRHRRILKVVAQPAVGLDEDVLDDVAGVNPSLDHLVHPMVDEPPDRRAVPIEQAVDGITVTLAHPLEQQKCLVGWSVAGSWRQCLRHRRQSTNVS